MIRHACFLLILLVNLASASQEVPYVHLKALGTKVYCSVDVQAAFRSAIKKLSSIGIEYRVVDDKFLFGIETGVPVYSVDLAATGDRNSPCTIAFVRTRALPQLRNEYSFDSVVHSAPSIIFIEPHETGSFDTLVTRFMVAVAMDHLYFANSGWLSSMPETWVSEFAVDNSILLRDIERGYIKLK